MRIETIAEHSVDVDLLPKKAKILDLGCRGFLFADEMVRRGHEVYPVDIDLLHPCSMKYFVAAISGTDGECSIEYSKDPQATRISPGTGVKMYTLKSFSEYVGVEFWDYIKTDVEGSEYEIIMSLTEAQSIQFEVEFHLHTGMYTEKEVEKMVNKLISLGYKIASHEKTSQHGMGYNYWSSLFIYDKN